MSTKYVILKESDSTTDLPEGSYLIGKPTFLDEIKSQSVKAPKNKLAGPFHLRAIADAIAFKYDPERMTGYSVKVHQYEGRPYKNDEELSAIVVEMLQACYPPVFDKYVEYHVKNRPANAQVVYYVDTGVATAIETFHKNGLVAGDVV